MEEILTQLTRWGGIVLTLVIALLMLIMALSGGIKKEERQIKSAVGHYVLRYPASNAGRAVLFLLAGLFLDYGLGWYGTGKSDTVKALLLVLEFAFGIAAAFLFGYFMRKYFRFRIVVNEQKISVYPVFGDSFETSFSNIRSVKRITKGDKASTESDSMILRTRDGKKFKADRQMSSYRLFEMQTKADVQLPNLTKKFKKQEDDFTEDDD